jgi:hypothetical protein
MKKFFLMLPFAAAVISCNNGTCTDGIMNQDETAIDCGGVCPPCETCDDGIMNQDEVGIDCGGVCAPCDIIYDSTGTFGENILFGDDSLVLPTGDYSFQAKVLDGSSLSIKIELVTGTEWFYAPSSNNGWSISNYSSFMQTFDILNPGNYIVNFHLADGPTPADTVGSFNIKYFENGSSLTKMKHVYWYEP